MPYDLQVKEAALPDGAKVVRPADLGIPVIIIPSDEPWRPWGGGPESWDHHIQLAQVIDEALVWANLECFLELRGTTLEALPQVLRTGADVHPADAVIWVADDPQKCLEYGQLLLVYQKMLLDRTFREIDAVTPKEDVEELRRTFPTVLTSQEGSRLWLSRLPESDRRVGMSYESDYARWIPGDARTALRAIVAIGPLPRIETLMNELC